MQREFKTRYAFKLVGRLAIAAAVAALIAAAAIWRGENMPIAAALAVGAFVAATLVGRVPALLAPGWDGVVTGKTVRYTTTRGKTNVPEYALTVTDAAGREHHDYFLDSVDNGEPNRVEYYNNGERVRRHRGFLYFEKFDKNGKSSVICIGCGKLDSNDRNICKNCGLPLLKDDIYTKIR